MAAKEHVDGLPSPSSRKMISWPPTQKLTLPESASRSGGAGASALRQVDPSLPERAEDAMAPTLLRHRLPPRLRTPFEHLPPVSSDMRVVDAPTSRWMRLAGIMAVIAVIVALAVVWVMV